MLLSDTEAILRIYPSLLALHFKSDVFTPFSVKLQLTCLVMGNWFTHLDSRHTILDTVHLYVFK